MITNAPISAVLRTCVPPQSSREYAVDLDDAHLRAVLLAEEHHGAQAPRLLDRGQEGAHRDRLEDLLVHAPLDPLALLLAERSWMAEVEAQLVGPHRRAGLLDVLAEHLAQAPRAAGGSPCGWPSSGSGQTRRRARAPASGRRPRRCRTARRRRPRRPAPGRRRSAAPRRRGSWRRPPRARACPRR